MNNDIKVNKSNKSITFVNNGIAFSQFGIADEILDLIINLQEEVTDLRESDWAWHQTLKIQNAREYRSKFLKDFQKEYGTNTYPDYDEIYKRYDKMKLRTDKALDKLYCYGEVFDSKILQQFQKEMENILQGEGKDE